MNTEYWLVLITFGKKKQRFSGETRQITREAGRIRFSWWAMAKVLAKRSRKKTQVENLDQVSAQVQLATTCRSVWSGLKWFRALLGFEVWRSLFQILCGYLDLFSVVPSSTPRPRCVNSQQVSFPPVGIINSLCSIFSICFIVYSSPQLAQHWVLNILDSSMKLFF